MENKSFTILPLLLLLMPISQLFAQGYCVSGCNPNTDAFSVDLNTI
ncbi:MAG: hypothetical protein WBJ84_09785 [Bacteroidales bacterium]